MSETPAKYIINTAPVAWLDTTSPLENPYRGLLVVEALYFARAHQAYQNNQCAMLYSYYSNALDLLLECAARYEEAEASNDR